VVEVTLTLPQQFALKVEVAAVLQAEVLGLPHQAQTSVPAVTVVLSLMETLPGLGREVEPVDIQGAVETV
jgi:hypothetical protein